jgi:hypothetical protein
LFTGRTIHTSDPYGNAIWDVPPEVGYTVLTDYEFSGTFSSTGKQGSGTISASAAFTEVLSNAKWDCATGVLQWSTQGRTAYRPDS